MYWVFLSIPAVVKQQNITATVTGPMTAAQYRAKYGDPNNGVNPPNGFPNKLLAAAAAAKYNRNPDQAGGVNAPGMVPGIGGAPGLGTNPLSGIAAIGDLANRLTQPSLWIRVGEFAAGIVLLIVGLNAMTKGDVRTATTGTIKKGASFAKAVAK